jgi:hypothetical protein
MADASAQSFSNHTRYDPLFHFFILPVFVITLIASVVHAFRRPGLHSAWLVVFMIAALMAVFKLRLYPLKVQDRVIRLEERLRLVSLLDPALRPRIGELTESQLVALRFASDISFLIFSTNSPVAMSSVFSLPRVRTFTLFASDSLSPTTSRNGTFCMACSRIFAFIFSLRESTSTRTPAARSCDATFSAYSDVALGDWDHRDLHGREPDRERSGVVLDQHAEEALDRSVERAVNHQRLLARAVFGYVFELEALRQVEVELHGRELPQASDGVDQFHVDLGAVERGFAGDGLVFDVQLSQRAFEMEWLARFHCSSVPR